MCAFNILQSLCLANIFLFKVNNRNTRKRCEICSKLTIKTPERRDVTGVVLVFLLLTLNIFHTFSSVSIVDFKKVNISWVYYGESEH